MKITILIILFTYNLVFSQDTIHFGKQSSLVTITFRFQTELDTVINNRYNFDGYFIISMDSLQIKQPNNELIKCSLYWIDQLEYIDDLERSYHCIPFLRFLLSSNIIKEKNKESVMKDFLRFYQDFNFANYPIFNTYLYEGTLDGDSNKFTTDIFYTSKIWSYKDKFYIIYKSNFTTAIVKAEVPFFTYGYGYGYKIENCNIFIPISNLREFTEISEDSATSFGLVKNKFVFENP